jgi:hypothetical protein
MEKDKIQKTIEESGNNFHYQVVNFLRDKGWFVSISPYYNDIIGNRPREIDIVADRQFDVKERSCEKYKGTLLVRLFIECKYINKVTVFWFDIKDEERAINKIRKDTSLKPPSENDLINNHHYLKDNTVAELFASPDKTPDNEPIYKALTQSLNAMVYYGSDHPIIPEEKQGSPTLKKLKYPLIICNDFKNFFKVDSNDKRGYSEVCDNFQLEVNYAYRDIRGAAINEYFIIDIINFQKFNQFLEELENTDISIISYILQKSQ